MIDNAQGTLKFNSFVDVNGNSHKWIPALYLKGESLPSLTCDGATPSYSSGCELLLAYDENNDGKISDGEYNKAKNDWLEKEKITTREYDLVADVWARTTTGQKINTVCPNCYIPPTDTDGDGTPDTEDTYPNDPCSVNSLHDNCGNALGKNCATVDQNYCDYGCPHLGDGLINCGEECEKGMTAGCMVGNCRGKKVCDPSTGKWGFCQKIDPCCGISCPICKYCSGGRCLPKADGTICGEGKVCKNGECVWRGRDECQRGTFSCEGSIIRECKDCDADPFAEWCPVRNCSQYNDWRVEGKRWVEKSICQEKEQRKMVYRKYHCWAWRYYSNCWSDIAEVRWEDTGLVRNKPDGTKCAEGKECRQGQCVSLGEMKAEKFEARILKPERKKFIEFKMKYQGAKTLNYYQFQIWENSNFTGRKLYDSGKMASTVSPHEFLSFVLETLPPSITGKYYARVKFWDAWQRESEWINLGEVKEIRVY